MGAAFATGRAPPDVQQSVAAALICHALDQADVKQSAAVASNIVPSGLEIFQLVATGGTGNAGARAPAARLLRLAVELRVLVQEALAHGVAELKGRQRAANLEDLVVTEAEAQIHAPLELLQVVVGQAPCPAHPPEAAAEAASGDPSSPATTTGLDARRGHASCSRSRCNTRQTSSASTASSSSFLPAPVFLAQALGTASRALAPAPRRCGRRRQLLLLRRRRGGGGCRVDVLVAVEVRAPHRHCGGGGASE